MSDFLCTIKNEIRGLFKDRGSKFIGILVPVYSEKEIQDKISEVKYEFPDATHHCLAWRISPEHPIEFSADDGEPSGSAGLPMLNALRSASLINCMAIVVRYYGGTKLGKSGLIHAYGESVRMTLLNATLYPVECRLSFKVRFPYDWHGTADQLIRTFDIQTEDTSYGEKVKHTWLLKPQFEKQIMNHLQNAEHLGVNAEHSHRKWIMLDQPI